MKLIAKIRLIVAMGFLTSCFGQNNEKTIYLAGWEAEFNGDEQCQKFLETQVIDKKTANIIWSSIELVFKDDKLIRAFDFDEGNKTIRELNERELSFNFVDLKPNQLYQLHASSTSKSYLGGEPPAEFTIPKFEFNAPFQYLGKFSKSDDFFSWLPFDLHLVAPIYLNFDKLYVDYSDPMNPKVINLEELKETDNSYDDLKPDSEIVFKKVHFKGKKANDFGYGMGHTGVPSWIQYPEIPSSPKNNKTMKFLCELRSDIGVETKRTNVKPKEDWYKQYFEHLNFWGDGDLYIFFEPESKVACFIIQNN